MYTLNVVLYHQTYDMVYKGYNNIILHQIGLYHVKWPFLNKCI